MAFFTDNWSGIGVVIVAGFCRWTQLSQLRQGAGQIGEYRRRHGPFRRRLRQDQRQEAVKAVQHQTLPDAHLLPPQRTHRLRRSIISTNHPLHLIPVTALTRASLMIIELKCIRQAIC